MRSKDMIPRIVPPGYVHKVWGVKTRASSPTSCMTLSKLLNPFEPQILFLVKENDNAIVGCCYFGPSLWGFMSFPSHVSAHSNHSVNDHFSWWLLHWFPCSSDGKESTWNAGDLGLIPGSGRSPGEGNGNPLQYSCLENSTYRGTQQATVHGVKE